MAIDQSQWHGAEADVAKPVVLAFGGNALLPDARDPSGQEERAREFARAIIRLLPEDAGLVLVHGNGPQVGMILLRVEATRDQLPPETLDVMVAETQGSIGYLLARALRNAMRAEDEEVEVATVATQVVVDEDDDGWKRPTKPVGPYYTDAQAVQLQTEKGWNMVRVAGKGLRRVVPSPRPKGIVELHTIADAVGHGHIVIAGGGGGIPVIRDEDGSLHGVEAVIDKDRTAALLAASLDAQEFVILTGVANVSLDFGTDAEQPLPRLSIDDAARHLADGQFPPGSMGPKIEACIDFARRTGHEALITDVDHLELALKGEAGTWIHR